METINVDEKYKLYESTVQDAPDDVEFIREKCKELGLKKPRLLREDFCGTGWLACEWAKVGSDYKSVGLDLDPVPLDYGKKVHFGALSPKQKLRVKLLEEDVMGAEHRGFDVIAAFNFSYSIFKRREMMVKYFKSVWKSLKPGGVFFLDIMGGWECQQKHGDVRKHDSIKYFWKCKGFNPVDHSTLYSISFKLKGKKRLRDVFVYDWRLWSIPELRDIMEEVGFASSHVFWEGDDNDGGGNGIYSRVEKEESCESWVSYIAGVKGKES